MVRMTRVRGSIWSHGVVAWKAPTDFDRRVSSGAESILGVSIR